MDYQAWQSLTALFFDQAARLGDKPFLWAKRDGHYQALTWNQVAERVSRLSRGLRRLGVTPGDRVVLVSESRPPGRYEVQWDGTGGTGRRLASGVYFARLVSGSNVHVHKMLLVK